MPLRFSSSYLPLDQPCQWLKGNHHGHSNRSDGEDEPEDILRAYEAAGYDYCALSEHDLYVDPRGYGAVTQMVILPAVEITSRIGQTLMFLGATADIPRANSLSLREICEFVNERHGLFVVDHPNWVFKPAQKHASAEEILATPDVNAIEVYTGVIERLPGSAHAADVWDHLLTLGRIVYGHAVDDQHSAIDHFLGWNCVQCPDGDRPDARVVISALKAGRFIASTGVSIRSIGTANDGREIRVESDAESIRWVIRDGVVADVVSGGTAQLRIEDLPILPRLSRPWRLIKDPKEALYVRVEAIGRNGQRAWSQPFWIEAAEA